MTRHLIGGLLFSLAVSATADAASIVVVARKPDLTCPKTDLGDAALQDRYTTMWDRYQSGVEAATRTLRTEIDSQTKSATAAGNLDLALFWKSVADDFGRQGELRWEETALKKSWNQRFGGAPFPADFMVTVRKASEAYASATKDLEKGYGELVAEFTKAEKLEQALQVRGELRELLAEHGPAPQPTPVPPPQPTPKPKPEPKPDARPANGKYRLVFNDGARSGFLLELQDDILWIHGDINPAKPNGISVWPNPRAVPCRFIGTKVLTDDGDPSTNKWRCAITWDTKTNEVSYLYDNYKGTRQQKQGRITAGAW